MLIMFFQFYIQLDAQVSLNQSHWMGTKIMDQLRPQKFLRFHKDTKHLILNLLFIRKRVKLSRQLNSYYPSFKALL